MEHPTYLFFFVGTVLVVGGIGTWVEIFKLTRPSVAQGPYDGLITSLITFCFALVSTSCSQIIIEESENKALRALAQTVLFVAVSGGALALVVVASGQWGLLFWSFASLGALAVWWFANAKSPGLKDPDAPTGGSVDRPMSGSTAGYIT